MTVEPTESSATPAQRSPAASRRGLFGRGLWGLIDQGLFAGTNFLLNVFLARSLAPVEYGAFALTFSIFLFLGIVQSALFSEPMLIFGAGPFEDRRAAYFGLLVRWHLAFSLLILGLGAVAVLLCRQAQDPRLGEAFLGMALAAPLMLLVWLARRACYAALRTPAAALGSGLYLLLLLGWLYAATRAAALDLLSAYLILGGTSLPVALAIFWRLGVRPRHLRRAAFADEAFARHLDYSRWSLIAGGLLWVPGNLFFVLLPLLLSGDAAYQATAALRAALNLMAPWLQITTVLSLLLPPTLVSLRGTAAFDRLVRRSHFHGILGSALYWLILFVFGRPLMHLLYDGTYDDHAVLLPILGLVPVINTAVAVAGAAVRALERPDWIFRAALGTALVMIPAGIWLVHRGGVLGAAWGMALAYLLLMVLQLVGLQRLRRQGSGHG